MHWHAPCDILFAGAVLQLTAVEWAYLQWYGCLSQASYGQHAVEVFISCFVPQVKEAALELGYQPDETFCLKISQLREIFVVRWSVFLLGPAGCGKSAIWKTLMRAQQNFGEKTMFKPINPKVSWSASLS